jgi:hypothetical protein
MGGKNGNLLRRLVVVRELVDHIIPLKSGGADKPENMQWQTREVAKAKDRIE